MNSDSFKEYNLENNDSLKYFSYETPDPIRPFQQKLSSEKESVTDPYDNILSEKSIHIKPSIEFNAFSFNSIVNNLFENPDGIMTNTQRTFIVIYTACEAYRTIISSYLVVFVPQNCGGYSCTLIQNTIPMDNLETAAIAMNTCMAFYFCALFYVERERETVVNLHLVSDKKSPTNKEYLMDMINSMDALPKRKIMRLNNWYRFCAQSILLVFFVNVTLSCVVIYKNYLNNTTATVFITNALVSINRIYKALKITSSGEYNIYSAYRTDSMLYNRDRSTWLQHETAELERYLENPPFEMM